ncbi:iron chaperone [Parapedobacter sp.]
MAKTDFKTIDEYQSTFPVPIRERMQQIREVVKEAVPGIEEVISYQIPAFKIGKFFLIYYSAYTNHISLSSPWSDELLKEFADDLKGYKVSRSAIQLPNDRPLPLDLIKRIVSFRKNEYVHPG